MRRISDKMKAKYRSYISQGIAAGTFTINCFSKDHGIDRDTVRRLIYGGKLLKEKYTKYKAQQENGKAQTKTQPPPYKGQEVDRDFNDKKGTATVTTRSLNIKTVEKLLKIAEVDTSIWEVERHLINTWEVTVGGIKTGTGKCETFTNYQVKVWMKRTALAISALENLYEKIKDVSFVVPVIKRIPEKNPGSKAPIRRELEISLFDLHLGLRCFKGMADCDWTPDMAEKMTMEILDDLLCLTAHLGPFERIIFPMGNDFLHSDNVYNTTTSFTQQPEADAWQNTFLRGEMLGLAIIERMKKVAPVKIITVPGNHARHTEIALSRIFNAYYHNDENVEIDAGSSPFKFHNFGVNLLGFEHGHSIRQVVRLAALMANECKDIWSQTLYREWHLGDQHRKGSSKPCTFEEQGVSVEYLPGLTPPNEWHRIHSYNWQKRAGMAFIWDATAGCIARFQRNIDNYSGRIMK